MKVIFLTSSAGKGGAWKAAERLALALKKAGVELKIVSMNDQYKSKLVRIIDLLYDRAFSALIGYKGLRVFSKGKSFSRVLRKVLKRERPDIVHVHWVHSGAIDLRELHFFGKTPILWTMHDNWLFTGGCHMNYGCEQYKVDCSRCPQLFRIPLLDSSSKYVLRRKVHAFTGLNLTPVALNSRYLAMLKQSRLPGKDNAVLMKNIVDTSKFYEIPELGDTDSINIAIGANSLNTDINKGFDLFVEGIKWLSRKLGKNEKVTINMFGDNKVVSQELTNLVNINVNSFGTLHNESQINEIVNKSDVFVCSSRQENLSNAIIEAMAAGCPVVAFDVGGNPDIIKHKINGFLAPPYDVEELARGIHYCCLEENKARLSSNAKSFVIENFSEELIVKEYLSLYKSLI